MSKPLVVSIPHRLGKDEAIRRITDTGSKPRYGQNTRSYSRLPRRPGTRLGFAISHRVAPLDRAVSGTIDVAEDSVRLEIFLPWLLAKLAETLQPLIRREGTLMLEKK